MALPFVKIKFSNGAIGAVTPSAECVVGMFVTAVAVSTTFELGKAYQIYHLSEAESLGLVEGGTNDYAYQQVKMFYDQAGEGSELWIYGVASTVKVSQMLDKTKDYGKDFIQQAGGRLRVIACCKDCSSATFTLTEGLDDDVMTAAANGQALAEWATDELFAPLFVMINGAGFVHGAATSVPDLTQKEYNRVCIFIGELDTAKNYALALLAGKVASIPVQRHIGRVADGALECTSALVGGKDASVSENESLNTKGYITFRTFIGKSGYYFTDDNMATSVKDDYHSIANRRVIDKAFRVTYDTMIEKVNEEIPITDNGNLPTSVTHTWQSMLETAIMNNMTAYGNLGVDPDDDKDTGVEAYIDPNQSVLKTSTINITLGVKPYGYAKYINVSLGFKTE